MKWERKKGVAMAYEGCTGDCGFLMGKYEGSRADCSTRNAPK